MLAAPTYRQLRDATEPTLFQVAEELGLELKHRKADGYIEIPEFGYSKILLRTLENPDRLRGPNLAFFGVDEASFASEAAWLRLEGRLRDPLATERAGLGAWTPAGFNWIYRKFIKQERSDPSYRAVLATPLENTYLPADFYAGLFGSYAQNFARQELLGEYLNVFSGRAYDSFASENGGNIWRANGKSNYEAFLPCVYHRDRPILWTMDFNITPATSVIAQTISYNPKPWMNPLNPPVIDTSIGGNDKQLNVLDELYLADTNTEDHCAAFYAKIKPKLKKGFKTRVIVYGDASGASRHSSASDSDYTIIRRFFARHSDEMTLETRVPAANPAVRDRVNAVNAMCANYNGVRRLAVHERCRELIRDLEECAWSLDSAGNTLGELSKKNPARNHVADAIGYLIHSEFALRASIGYRRGIIQ